MQRLVSLDLMSNAKQKHSRPRDINDRFALLHGAWPDINQRSQRKVCKTNNAAITMCIV
jgi:hypothetical protein